MILLRHQVSLCWHMNLFGFSVRFCGLVWLFPNDQSDWLLMSTGTRWMYQLCSSSNLLVRNDMIVTCSRSLLAYVIDPMKTWTEILSKIRPKISSIASAYPLLSAPTDLGIVSLILPAKHFWIDRKNDRRILIMPVPGVEPLVSGIGTG